MDTLIILIAGTRLHPCCCRRFAMWGERERVSTNSRFFKMIVLLGPWGCLMLFVTGIFSSRLVQGVVAVLLSSGLLELWKADPICWHLTCTVQADLRGNLERCCDSMERDVRIQEIRIIPNHIQWWQSRHFSRVSSLNLWQVPLPQKPQATLTFSRQRKPRISGENSWIPGRCVEGNAEKDAVWPGVGITYGWSHLVKACDGWCINICLLGFHGFEFENSYVRLILEEYFIIFHLWI